MDYKETDAEVTEAEEGSAKRPAAQPPVKAGKYRFFSLILFVLTAGGLFLGLLGNVVSWLKPSYYSGSSGLNNSLLGFFFTRMRELFGNIKGVFTGSPGVVFQHVFAILAACVLLATVLVSAVSLIVTFVSPRRAKKATAVGGTVSLLAYTLFFVWAFCVNSLTMQSFGAAAIDVPVALTTLLLFLVMTVYAVIENGRKGLFGAGIYVFAIVICFALFFPGSFPESHFYLLETFTSNPIYNTFILITVLVILAGLITAVIGLPGDGKGTLRLILFTVEFIAVLFLAIASCGLDNLWNLQFFQNSAFLPSIVLIFASLGAMLLSIFAFVLTHYGQEASEEEDDDFEDEEEPLEEEEEEEEKEEEKEEEESQAEEPEREPELHTLPEPAEEPVPVVAEWPAEEVLPEEEPVPAAEAEPEMSDFEREMLSFAEKGEEVTEPEAETPDVPPQPFPQYAPQPFRAVNVYTDPSMQYVYDPFINELTPEEKNEFGDLFIACKSGKYGDLPIYRIGGDNTEFFDKVWIRYGLYDMSQPLRDKLFSYLRRYRSKQQ